MGQKLKSAPTRCDTALFPWPSVCLVAAVPSTRSVLPSGSSPCHGRSGAGSDGSPVSGRYSAS